MPTFSNTVVRSARPTDIPRLLELMRALAVFEDYIDGFAVTESALQTRAFGSHPQCFIWVAENASAHVNAYAVAVVIPYTYDLRPTILLKELYVDETARGGGAGKALLIALSRWAVGIGAGRMKWDVLLGNENAEHFYRGLGASRDPKWLAYGMDDVGLRRLATSASAQAQ